MIKVAVDKSDLGGEALHKIGIMGGTFDPIHYGHLVTAEEARSKFKLDKVIFVPSGNPPHKINQEVTNKNHRYVMTLLATATNPYFEVSRNEIDREGYSYTIDTIRELKKGFIEDVQFYFITGADALNEIFTWKDTETLFSECAFIAATRPGYQREKLFLDVQNINRNYNSKIYFIEVPSLAISSTDIRMRVYKELPIKYLLPEAVEAYIYKMNLYR